MDVEFIRYQFEDGYYGVITKNDFKIGVRHIQMLYMFASSVVIGIIRGSMGVAVMAINQWWRRNDTYIQIHNWDARIQGAVLSSFFIGYALMLLPSELFLRKVGGKPLMTAMLLVNGVLCVAMPTIVNKGGWVAACNANLFMGMSHGCFYTVNRALIDVWLPPSERNVFSCLIHGGVQIGIVIGIPVSLLLSTTALGWELIYYTLAILALSLAVISATLTASSPDKHPAVGDTEKEMIKETSMLYRKKKIRKPWRNILTSYKFWAVTCVHAASNALFVFCLAFSPAYQAMHMKSEVTEVLWTFAMPFAAMAAAYFIFSPIIQFVTKIKLLSLFFSPSFIRKIVCALGALGIVMGLTLETYSRYYWNWKSLMVLTATLSCLGFQFCGLLSSYRHMTENFSGTLMTLFCTFSSVIGGAVPFVFGLILGDNMTNDSRLRIVFLSLSSFYVVCTAVYIAFGSSERQPWDYINEKHKGHFNGLIDDHYLDEEGTQQDKNGHSTYISHKNEIDTAL